MKKSTLYPLANVLLLTLFMSFAGCQDDFLEIGLFAELEETNFMQSESDARLATNAIYNVLREWRYHGGFPIVDIMSDDAAKGSNPTDGIQILAFDDFSFTPDAASVSGWYSQLYVGIKRANLVINRTPEIAEMSELSKAQLIGEARFLRALTYFQLVRVYGDVPLILTVNPERKVARSPASEVYDLVLEDLLYAAENLPERSDYPIEELGRATRGAAKGLLAKVYLFREDFANAEKFALEVINSGEYSLDPDFGNALAKAGEFGPGSIFEVGATDDGFAQGGNQYGNTQGIRGTPDRGWGFNRPSYDLIQAFENDDPRMDATIAFLGEALGGSVLLGDPTTPDTTYFEGTNTIKELECYNQKAWTPGTTPLASWDHNVRMLRYADVLLMAAEALNENGKTNEALAYLNQVRERARGGNPNILPDISETNQAALRQLIWDERRFELALEQHRFFDLVRTGQAADVLGPLGFVAGKHELFPIPQSEIDLSEGTLTQNPGW
ncbi:MAG: RagB/SusD family nutrient uptake outer membrane protein [Bacteroidota bacterium]